MTQNGDNRHDGENTHNGQGTEDLQDAQNIQDVQHLLDRAHVLMCQCKYAEALPLSQRAVELAPQSLKAWQDLGSNYGDLNRVADLEQAFERALQLTETPWDEVETWFYKGHAENNADAWEAALRSFQKMAELEPDWGAPYLFQAMVLGNIGAFIDKRYFEDMLVATDRALTLGGLSTTDQRVVYELKVRALYGLGRSEETAYYQRKAEESRQAEQAEQAERAASSQAEDVPH